ncbi:hypothetical protein [Janthinobacterium sp. RA13]|uniref:hypothetical protein n=1 Tax=Janthinobacterium sp. RA13 TaxID=1502762 RepID=UPI001269C0CB|nr:hypothetical protein [Janthinobacterium sp. RA13]
MNMRVVPERCGGAHRVDISLARMAAAFPTCSEIPRPLDLTERVAEIQHMPAYTDEFWKLYADEMLLPEWRTPEATP